MYVQKQLPGLYVHQTDVEPIIYQFAIHVKGDPLTLKYYAILVIIVEHARNESR